MTVSGGGAFERRLGSEGGVLAYGIGALTYKGPHRAPGFSHQNVTVQAP